MNSSDLPPDFCFFHDKTKELLALFAVPKPTGFSLTCMLLGKESRRDVQISTLKQRLCRDPLEDHTKYWGTLKVDQHQVKIINDIWP
jgi:hypothetical protein